MPGAVADHVRIPRAAPPPFTLRRPLHPAQLGVKHVLAQHICTMVVHLADERVRTVEVRQVRVEPGLIVLDLPGQQVARVLIFGLDQEGPIAGRLEHRIDLGRFINGPDLERRLEDLGLAGLDVMAKELVQPRLVIEPAAWQTRRMALVRPWLDPATLSGRGGSSSTAYRKRTARNCPQQRLSAVERERPRLGPSPRPLPGEISPRGSLQRPSHRADSRGRRSDRHRSSEPRSSGCKAHDRHQRCRIS